MKRKLRTFVHYLIHSLILGMPMVLYVDAQRKCTEVTYLEVGKEGFISCSLEPFYSVSLYTKEDYDEEEIPLLNFNGNQDGHVDEYDVHPNGSFIFRNVSFDHAGNYIVTMLEDITSDLFVKEVYVGVYVTPYPQYPVVEGHTTQQHVYMDANRNGQLNCSMRHVYPNVSLSWTVVDPIESKMILFQDDVVKRKQNEDNTFDITLTSLYEVANQHVRRITIQCGVANEIGEVLSSKTKVDLLFSSVHPVVNGHFNQKHVYLDVDRKGYLTCIKENVDAGTTLAWKVVDPSIQEKITFQSRAIILNNKDGKVTINQTFDYEIHDHLLDRITIECLVVIAVTDDIPLATRVDLLLQNVYPVVNGHFNQKHVYLDVDREGHLTCIKENVDASTTLVWKVADPSIQKKITSQSRAIVLNNNDGTVTINQTFDYEVHDHMLDRITLECKVVIPDTDDIPIATKVDLLLQNAPPVPLVPPVPVIDGCYNKQDGCILGMPRKGELACGVMKSQQQVELRWKCAEDSIIFKEDKMVVKNHSDAFDVSIFTSYDIYDETIDLVTIQCEVIGWRGEAPPAAKVSLILEKATEPGLELKANALLVLMTVHLVVIFCVSFVIFARMRRMRKQIKVLDTLLRNVSNGSGGDTGRSSTSQNIGLELHWPVVTSGEPYVVQKSEAGVDPQESTALMDTAENGYTAGSSESDSGKGSGSDSRLDHTAKPFLSDSGREVATDTRENNDLRDTKNKRLVQTILKVFHHLYEKYLSHEGEIEDTLAIINEEEKGEN